MNIAPGLQSEWLSAGTVASDCVQEGKLLLLLVSFFCLEGHLNDAKPVAFMFFPVYMLVEIICTGFSRLGFTVKSNL